MEGVTVMHSGDLLDQLDQLVGSVAAPAYQPHSPQYLPAPLRATYEETRAAAGPTFTVTITRDAQTYIESRRETRDAAVGRVTDAYRKDAKEGKPGAWDHRVAALAAIKVTIPDRAQAEERAAMAVACAVEDTWNSVLAELRNLYPTND